MTRLIFLSLLCISRITIAQVPNETTERANDFLKLVLEDRYQEATSYFEPIVLMQLPADKLEELWNTLNGQVGNFEKHTKTRTEQLQNWNIVFLTCKFERSILDLKLVFTAENKITGIFFVPPKPDKEYQLPKYATPTEYTENPFVVVSGSYKLPGTLTIPTNTNTFPIVILVHGSGPNDRDETIGPNKPFKDLAVGLANMGIGVLRYDKRTYIYKDGVETITIDDETVMDAKSALNQALSIEGCKSVYILGHSLGAFVGPKIATGEKNLSGLIMMAGNARPFEDLIFEQVNYILSENGLTDFEKEEIEKTKEQVELVKSPALSEGTPSNTLPLNIPANYWLDLRNYDPVKTAKKLKLPILILQGERDYQVTMTDFNIWKESLSYKKKVSLKSYPELNHLFMEGMGKSTPGEYLEPQNIPHYLIQDIATWIKNN
ncbi:MAG: DUF3887 domain-containing protein [Bacteroidales bacterium]|nr:DUF3887 domain-containing protein [Bacteroidales bacterium]